MMGKNSVLITVVVAILVGGLAFYGGMQYQKSQTGGFQQFGVNGTRRFLGQGGMGGGAVGAGNAQAVRGEVLSRDEKTVTVKLQDGSTKLVLISSATTITESTKAGETALSAGKQVMVFGSSNPDGSVGAQNISIGEVGGFGGRGASPSGQNQKVQ